MRESHTRYIMEDQNYIYSGYNLWMSHFNQSRHRFENSSNYQRVKKQESNAAWNISDFGDKRKYKMKENRAVTLLHEYNAVH